MISVKDEQGHSQVWSPTASALYRAQYRIDQILKSLKPSSHVLELGCGCGDLTRALLQAGHRVTAVDRSERMLAATLVRCQSSAALVTVKSDVLDFLEKEGSTFDAVVGMGILHHCVLDLEKTLRLIAPRLSTHGRGFFWEPNRGNPVVQFLFGTTLGRRLMALEPQEDAFTLQHLSKLLQKTYPRSQVLTQDWAYPLMPVFLQRQLRRLERHTPAVLNHYVSQSLWIEFYKSFEGSLDAKTESPR